MKADDQAYVAIEYTLTLDDGEVVDRSEPGDPLGFIFGSGQIIPGLEKGIHGMEAGETARVTVEPEEAYGHPKPELVRGIPRENFPADLEIEPGMGFEARGPHGPVTFRVQAVTDDEVMADFNHPLAGKRLTFDVKIAEVREARAEELAGLMGEGGCSPTDCGTCGGSCG
ncbi:MAG: peptidylprolyl isomerase [Deferrisomatales bacterium]